MSFSLYNKSITSSGTRFIDGKWVTQTNSVPEIVPTIKAEGIALLGQSNALPYKSELANIYTNKVNYDSAARIIIVNPHASLLQTILSKVLVGEITIILTFKVQLSNIPSHINIFAINQELPGHAAVLTSNNVTYISGKLATVLLYTILFNHTKSSNAIFQYRLNYFCPPSVLYHKKPNYNNSNTLCKLIDFDESNNVDSITNTIICACHFTNKNDVNLLFTRCTKLANAIRHINILFVFSLSPEMQDELTYINSFATENIYFINDINNAAIDAGKYLLGLKHLRINDICSNGGVVTLFNDSVLMSDDLTSFSNDYGAAIHQYDIVGCTSSNQKSFHLQSWFISFKNVHAITDYVNILHNIEIDTNNARESVIDQMEVGLSTFLAIKYRVIALYPVHLLSDDNVIGSTNPTQSILRNALEHCGLPFIKKRLIRDLSTVPEHLKNTYLGVNLAKYK